ncbi:MAG: ATP-binding protein, partial [Pirellulaceae bacterium]
EEIALQALMAGAADFVPKTRLATDLAQAAAGVLAVSGGRCHERIASCLKEYEVRYELESDPSLIPPLLAELQETACDLGIVNKADRVRLGKAIGAALENAMVHGNLELTTAEMASGSGADSVLARRRQASPYGERHVFVSARLTPEEARITIRDEGPGFNVTEISGPQSTPEQLISGEGRGLVLIRTFLDEVQFNHAGNEITLVKWR